MSPKQFKEITGMTPSYFGKLYGFSSTSICRQLRNGYCEWPRRFNPGKIAHPLYTTWSRMIDRCHNKEDANYHNYGARGIVVCQRWRDSFDSFVEDVGVRPRGTTLDRIDNDKGYSPDNCRWADKSMQGRNKRGRGYSQYRGVGRKSGRWRVYSRVNGRMFHLGYFDTEIQALRAREEFELENRLL